MRVFVSLLLTTTRDFSEIQRSILLIMIICEIVLSILICLFWGIKIYHGWHMNFIDIDILMRAKIKENSAFRHNNLPTGMSVVCAFALDLLVI